MVRVSAPHIRQERADTATVCAGCDTPRVGDHMTCTTHSSYAVPCCSPRHCKTPETLVLLLCDDGEAVEEAESHLSQDSLDSVTVTVEVGMAYMKVLGMAPARCDRVPAVGRVTALGTHSYGLAVLVMAPEPYSYEPAGVQVMELEQNNCGQAVRETAPAGYG